MGDAGSEAADHRAAGDDAGTYTLLIELDAPAAITVGAAGTRDLPAGWFAYTGSALGPAGFARIDRHRRVATGEHDVRHWHVDYLLGHPDARLVDAVRSAGVDAECEVARAIADVAEPAPVPGVGATDCECRSHLAGSRNRDSLEAAVRRAHRLARH